MKVGDKFDDPVNFLLRKEFEYTLLGGMFCPRAGLDAKEKKKLKNFFSLSGNEVQPSGP
jgi:hypothetical protein